MKEIKAAFAPQKLSAVTDALRKVPGYPGMTVMKAEAHAAPAPRAKTSIKDELKDSIPRVRIEIVAPDEVAEGLMEAIVAVVSTGAPGDSVVWMSDVERAAFVRKTV
ncbi:P-II family nitrogen regulator [Derxia gummosa]|uniref:P-II family nitrogen regulator n=1 Tax=Derxia gummosa DSM 723 TaxID=1121388 RepID=A0A8B6X2E7_9BURK|nr:P-II family nitrogen regulator [Derxia gummosa]